MPAERNAFRLGLTLIAFFVLAMAVMAFLGRRGGGGVSVQVRFPAQPVRHHDQAGRRGWLRRADCQEHQEGTSPGDARPEHRLPNALQRADGQCGFLAAACTTTASLFPEGPLLGGPGRLVILDRGVGEPIKAGQMVEGEWATRSFSALTRLLAAQLDPKDPASLLGTVKGQLNPAPTGDRSIQGKIHASLADVNAITASFHQQRVRPAAEGRADGQAPRHLR